ncbi:MAG: polysaccharide deacetylase family protein [Ferruginibacter sp.]
MDPDSANACFPYKLMELVTSQMAKTTVATVVFTSCYYSETDTDVTVSTVNFSKPDTAVVKLNNAGAPKKKKKTIYLTFDDGPNKGTKNMMHIVQEEEIPVTLFIVGEHVYGSTAQTAIFDSLVNCKYIEIANHSFTHAFKNKFAKFYQVPDSVVNDFKRCADSLQLSANIIRTPGRNIWRTKFINQTDISSSKTAADSLFATGYTITGWDLEWHYDNKLKLTNTNEEMMLQIDSMFVYAKTKTPDHLVLLAHDQVYEDPADSMELRQFIIKLKAKNEYNFELVSRYPHLKN